MKAVISQEEKMIMESVSEKESQIMIDKLFYKKMRNEFKKALSDSEIISELGRFEYNPILCAIALDYLKDPKSWLLIIENLPPIWKRVAFNLVKNVEGYYKSRV